ncbi:unnamed protein product [Chrysodeixis includens]|uniref:Uncharacterized protein n=1 Tax=Chrysodeixis includens TaxID=689277 RepID=A0A9N8KUX6_CHRIL|nr:unnamed protein product [Chrysodeixis includens]
MKTAVFFAFALVALACVQASPLIGPLLGGVGGLVKGVGEGVGSVANGVGNILGAVGKEVDKGLYAVGNTVGATVGHAVDKVGNTLGVVGDKVKEGAETLANTNLVNLGIAQDGKLISLGVYNNTLLTELKQRLVKMTALRHIKACSSKAIGSPRRDKHHRASPSSRVNCARFRPALVVAPN